MAVVIWRAHLAATQIDQLALANAVYAGVAHRVGAPVVARRAIRLELVLAAPRARVTYRRLQTI